MKQALPESFLHKIRALLGEDYSNFINTYDKPASRGLRINSLKVNPREWASNPPFAIRPIPWIKEGFYYDPAARPGKHPYHAAGLYYIQEPSAMAVVEALHPQAGERVLDVAAAPGGKATQIAVHMRHQGLLIANEVHSMRAKILSENIERLGITNAIVTNEEVSRLAERFPQYFDRILLDAPCSGEGMFRKDEDARVEWSPAAVHACSIRQDQLLELASQMLKPGGKLVYSTCTFSPEENEHVIEKFLQKHPDWHLLPVPNYAGYQNGNEGWSLSNDRELAKTVRLWPHHIEGEGHFIALLQKEEQESHTTSVRASSKTKTAKKDTALREAIRYWTAFANEYLTLAWNVPHDRYVLFGTQLYLLPDSAPSLDSLKVLRAGLHLGEWKKGRFEPSHALALALTESDFIYTTRYTAGHVDIDAYLRGDTISVDTDLRGWTVVLIDGHPLGWGKAIQGTLKNHYPKGLRLT